MEESAASEFNPIPDVRGMKIDIPKVELHIDHSYQREDFKPARVRRIAESWSWVACNTLSVSHRQDDGRFYVIDGQNRKLAADLRPDIATLPCMVYALPNRQAEAVAFYRLNVDRTPVSSISKYKDMLVAGYPEVVLVDEVVRSTGYEVSGASADFHVRCVKLLTSAARRDPATFERVWRLAAEVHSGQIIIDRVFGALFALEMHLKTSRTGFSLLDENNKKALTAAGLRVIEDAVDRGRTYHGNSGGKAGADGIVTHVLNKGRRSKRLPSPMASADDDGEDAGAE